MKEGLAAPARSGRQRSEVRVVELLGPAGCGKTTAAAALADMGWVVGARAPVPWKVFGAAQGCVVVGTALAQRAEGRWPVRAELRSMAYLTAWRRGLAGDRDGVHVLDHGPVYRLAQLRSFGPFAGGSPAFERWLWRTAVAWGGVLDGVAYLDAADDILLERIRRRSRHHAAQFMSEAQAGDFLGRYRAAFETTLITVAQQGAHVLRLDTGRLTPHQVSQRIRSACEQWTGG